MVNQTVTQNTSFFPKTAYIGLELWHTGGNTS